MSFPLKELKDTVGYSIFGAELGYVGGTWNFGTNISNGILTIYIYIHISYGEGSVYVPKKRKCPRFTECYTYTNKKWSKRI